MWPGRCPAMLIPPPSGGPPHGYISEFLCFPIRSIGGILAIGV